MDPFIGEIKMFGGNFAPRAWAFCNGQLLAISQNTALFSILGTTYGGDGRTTFALPDMRSRVAMHAGTGPGLTPRRIGQRIGTEYNNLTSNQMPSHTHSSTGTLAGAYASIPVSNAVGNKKKPGGNVMAVDVTDPTYTDASPTETYGSAAPVAGSVSVSVGPAGASSAVNNIQPSEVVNYIICLQGTFPSRN